jgi:hypothetical protein
VGALEEARPTKIRSPGEKVRIASVHRRLSETVLEASVKAQVKQVIGGRQSTGRKVNARDRLLEERPDIDAQIVRAARQGRMDLQVGAGLLMPERAGMVGGLMSSIAELFRHVGKELEIVGPHQDVQVTHGPKRRTRVEPSRERRTLQQQHRRPAPLCLPDSLDDGLSVLEQEERVR